MLGVNSFKKDPHSLLKITMYRLPFYLAAMVGCYLWKTPSTSSMLMYALPILLITANGAGLLLLGLFMGMGVLAYDQGMSWLDLAYTAAAVLITFPVTSLYHSATHMSLRPRFLNRWLGEAMSFWHNVGIDIWSVTHYFHHRHSDVVDLDPHPSLGQGFWAFTKDCGKTFPAAFKHHYFKHHPSTPRTERAYRLIFANFVVRNPVVTAIWFLLLGPRAFIYFYAMNIVFKKIHYAWFNWATHQKHDEKIGTENLNTGYYKFINAISFNLYYHHNHHKYPNLMNPKRVPEAYLRASTAASISTSAVPAMAAITSLESDTGAA